VESVTDRNTHAERGITIFELLAVVLIITLIAAIAIPVLAHARDQARRGAVIADSHGVYKALLRYNIDKGHFPPTDEFEKATLAPLTTNGYYDKAASFKEKLLGEEILVYIGLGEQFLIILKPKYKPDQVMYIGHTNLLEGDWIDGVYMLVDGRVVKAEAGS